MRRALAVAVLALGWMAGSLLAGSHKRRGDGCTLPSQHCPDCSGPCDHCRLPAFLHGGTEHVQELLEDLASGDDCERQQIVRKLGCQFHADFCANPEVLETLIGILLGDPCWQVRREAAWAIYGQDAHTDAAVLALYISSKLDPQYMVRARSTEALEIVTHCRQRCFAELYRSGDVLIKELRAANYQPGKSSCRVQLVSGGAAVAAPTDSVPAPTRTPLPPPGGWRKMPAPEVETLPAPRTNSKP